MAFSVSYGVTVLRCQVSVRLFSRISGHISLPVQLCTEYLEMTDVPGGVGILLRCRGLHPQPAIALAPRRVGEEQLTESERRRV